MRTTTSYLSFIPKGTSDSGLTKRWVVENTAGAILGWIQWKASWRKYWFEPTNGTGFDAVCLAEISEFLSTETMKHRMKETL